MSLEHRLRNWARANEAHADALEAEDLMAALWHLAEAEGILDELMRRQMGDPSGGFSPQDPDLGFYEGADVAREDGGCRYPYNPSKDNPFQ